MYRQKENLLVLFDYKVLLFNKTFSSNNTPLIFMLRQHRN